MYAKIPNNVDVMFKKCLLKTENLRIRKLHVFIRTISSSDMKTIGVSL